MSTISQLAFQDALSQISNATTSSDMTEVSEAFRSAFLAFASETPDNLECVRAIAVERFQEDEILSVGLTVNGIPVSSILNEAEGCDIPEQVRRYRPNLQQTEWESALRVATVILIAFEASSRDE